MRPEKRGEPVAYHVAVAGPDVAAAKTKDSDTWPVGTESNKSPRELAPVMMESLNVEIDGYTLAEAIDAIGPRIKIPIYWDHNALAAAHVDPTAIKVSVPKTRTYYSASSTASCPKPTSPVNSAPTKPARRFSGSHDNIIYVRSSRSASPR